MSGDLNRDHEKAFGAQKSAEGSRQLIFAILNQALWDATRPQWRRAQDAISFFFGDNARLYVELLGLDYERFLRELIEEMDSDVENERLTRAQKQTFRAHYERWLYGPTDLFY